MVNANFLWAVNVEREMLQRKLKGIVKHQHVLKEEVREPIKKSGNSTFGGIWTKSFSSFVFKNKSETLIDAI